MLLAQQYCYYVLLLIDLQSYFEQILTVNALLEHYYLYVWAQCYFYNDRNVATTRKRSWIKITMMENE